MTVPRAFVYLVAMFILTTGSIAAQSAADRKDWIQLFNGKNLDGWVMKITGYPLGENYGNTFRVENGVLKVSYDQYAGVRQQVRPHLLSHEVLALHRRRRVPVRRRAGEGRTRPGRCATTASCCTARRRRRWARTRTFPISVEAQLLGARTHGRAPDV